jgi:hypothetical protein
MSLECIANYSFSFCTFDIPSVNSFQMTEQVLRNTSVVIESQTHHIAKLKEEVGKPSFLASPSFSSLVV